MHVHATAKTDVGRVRERNEDAFLVDHDLGLFAVADGMGGHAGGARASSLTAETLLAYVGERREELLSAGEPEDQDPTPPLARLLADAVRAACATVFDAAIQDPSLAGMGTTCTVLLTRPGWAYVAHVGDSRCYMQRGSRFMQVTEDHSLVNEQVRAGILAPEAAAKSRLKNIITRSVGFEREVEVDTFLIPLQPADQFLLCSDGLSNLVENAELGEAMMAMRGEGLVKYLVDVALDRGGDDNVTVVAVRLQEGELAGTATDAEIPANLHHQSVTEPEVEVVAPAAAHGEAADGVTRRSDLSTALDATPPPLPPPSGAEGAAKKAAVAPDAGSQGEAAAPQGVPHAGPEANALAAAASALARETDPEAHLAATGRPPPFPTARASDTETDPGPGRKRKGKRK